jgi:hypothetical protein
MLGCFSENSAAVQGVVNDFSNGGSVGIYVHSVASTQMPQDTLSGDLKRHAPQFRVSPGLNMVDSENPLVERQMSIKSHGYLLSSNKPHIAGWF